MKGIKSEISFCLLAFSYSKLCALRRFSCAAAYALTSLSNQLAQQSLNNNNNLGFVDEAMALLFLLQLAPYLLELKHASSLLQNYTQFLKKASGNTFVLLLVFLEVTALQTEVAHNQTLTSATPVFSCCW